MTLYNSAAGCGLNITVSVDGWMQDNSTHLGY